jgi:hypothetical protein
MKIPRMHLVSLFFGLIMSSTFGAKSEDSGMIVKAAFNSDGTGIQAIGIDLLDGLSTEGSKLLHTRVEPSAMASFERILKWPDSAQVVKEFAVLKMHEGCDPNAAYCKGQIGVGAFETGYVGRGMMVKDPERFPYATGNWGALRSVTTRFPNKTATPCTKQDCESCHINLVPDTDYVISPAHTSVWSEGSKRMTKEPANDVA